MTPVCQKSSFTAPPQRTCMFQCPHTPLCIKYLRPRSGHLWGLTLQALVPLSSPHHCLLITPTFPSTSLTQNLYVSIRVPRTSSFVSFLFFHFSLSLFLNPALSGGAGKCWQVTCHLPQVRFLDIAEVKALQ